MHAIKNRFLKEIKDTFSYGLVKDNYQYYYDEKLILKENGLEENTLDYSLYKIKCLLNKTIGITGIQIFHQNRYINSEIIKTININSNIFDEEQEITFDPKEYINKISVWKDDLFKGLEIITTKNRQKIFGLCQGVKIDVDEFNGNNYLIGFNLGFEKSIINMGFYYINKKYFFLYLNLGVFMLRVKLKSDYYKNKIKENLNNIDYSDKALFNVCCLPDNQFFGVVKYIFN